MARDPLEGIEHEEMDDLLKRGLQFDEEAFALAYLRTGSLERAVRSSGLECRDIKASRVSLGEAIMRRPRVAEFIAERRRIRLDRLNVTNERIEQELAKIAFANVSAVLEIQEDGTAYTDLSLADEVDLAAIKTVRTKRVEKKNDDGTVDVLEVEVTMHDKLAALGHLAKIRKMVGADAEITANVDLAAAIREARQRGGLKDD